MGHFDLSVETSHQGALSSVARSHNLGDFFSAVVKNRRV